MVLCACLHSVVHETGKGVCYGFVENGMCIRCDAATPGVAQYAMKMILSDTTDESIMIAMTGKDRAGDSLFGMPASEFVKLLKFERFNKISEVLFHEYTAGIIFDSQDGDVGLSLFDIEKVEPAGV